MARRVGDDELPPGGVEVAVGHVDRDALLALGAQPVGQEGQVEPVVAPPPAGLLECHQLVVGDPLRVVEEATDQRALAVVDRPGRREAQQAGHARSGAGEDGGGRDRHQK